MPDWDTVILVGRVSHLYFAGTMQDGVLIFQKDGSRHYFVRRSYARACDESALPPEEIHPMETYRQIPAVIGEFFGKTLLEYDLLPLAVLQRMQKNWKMEKTDRVDTILSKVRAVKSPWELHWMEMAGKQHRYLLEEWLPTILREGMTETDLVGKIYDQSLQLGHQGVTRFAMFQNEVGVGQYAFGTNSLYPTCFDGPGGSRGMYAASPFVGNRQTKLQPGMSVFADMGYGVNGYHTDKTQVYFFQGKHSTTLSDEVLTAHEQCREIQKQIAEQLRPGVVPTELYAEIMESLSPEFQVNFQGFGERKVKFLGHGIGLCVDEYPVLAKGFQEPLQENICLAVEPKKGMPGFGTVGVEDTYVVTPRGGRCLTGGGREILVVS